MPYSLLWDDFSQKQKTNELLLIFRIIFPYFKLDVFVLCSCPYTLRRNAYVPVLDFKVFNCSQIFLLAYKKVGSATYPRFNFSLVYFSMQYLK